MSGLARNWAGNIAYGARRFHSPASRDELTEIVGNASAARVLGSRHSFSDIADTDSDLISTQRLDRIIGIDKAAGTVTIEGGVTYGQLCPALAAEGLALANLASLPHISVAGAVSTSTHGSGDRNGTLATSVRALETATADGGIVRFSRGDADFGGAVVSLGALGAIATITLDVEPAYQVKQEVYLGLPFNELVENFDALMGSAYSVSAFLSWRGGKVDQLWRKSRAGDPVFDPARYSARPADRAYHPIAALSAEPCTEQGGRLGPWHERLAHFRMGFTPSAGDELQSEYFVPRRHAAEALLAVQAIQEDIAPHLLISEIRTMKADELWLSQAYRQDCVGIHFTWKNDWPAVSAVLPKIEAQLAPFEPRPHWGKLFMMAPEAVRERYEKLDDFRKLARRLDPAGKFTNQYIRRTILN
ncbi:MAG: FAD-binding protein [Rhizobiaceae bacterium]|nr:FAD-binding protein [Rhizobiaceae bacterium]